ncbi:hypothetical protein GCM10010260_44660 [Streptomyces filipinensis]|uniref:Uncharacterized protein n=1 Tax=Streptomyces filipinensis TaxID=66887 RepID=A0A918MCS1_9ACTN|nr:hypothetical protein GCM10010260_44660 [Streptomyces filipinensis]
MVSTPLEDSSVAAASHRRSLRKRRTLAVSAAGAGTTGAGVLKQDGPRAREGAEPGGAAPSPGSVRGDQPSSPPKRSL